MSHFVRLYGSPLSNYYNKVKIALIELELPFDEVECRPGDNWPDAGSPSGKIPFIETEAGRLYETQPIIEYLEDFNSGTSLYPEAPLARAHCRELIQYIELYLELPARAVYPAAFWGKPVDNQLKEKTLIELAAGLKTFARRAHFSPWLCGNRYTHADSAAWVHLGTISYALAKVGEKGFLTQHLPELQGYLDSLRERPSIQQIERDRRDAARRL